MRFKKKNGLTLHDVGTVVKNALVEDLGDGDITCAAVVKKGLKIKATLIAKEGNIVVCGLGLIREVFRNLDKKIRVKMHVRDGRRVVAGAPICTMEGPAEGILMGERTALNFLGRLSAVATKTSNVVAKVKKYNVKVLDTRKTTPGLRHLEKYAVRIGGGYNHRFGLYDQVLIKDNHIRANRGRLKDIVARAKEKTGHKTTIEIEVTSLRQLKEVLEAAPDIIMLDNMTASQMRKAVALRNKINKTIKLEASGNITETNITEVAGCGVDFISLGALTHSIRAVDFSLKVK